MIILSQHRNIIVDTNNFAGLRLVINTYYEVQAVQFTGVKPIVLGTYREAKMGEDVIEELYSALYSGAEAYELPPDTDAYYQGYD